MHFNEKVQPFSHFGRQNDVQKDESSLTHTLLLTSDINCTFRLYLAIFSHFLQKWAILASIIHTMDAEIEKCNINVAIAVKMRG